MQKNNRIKVIFTGASLSGNKGGPALVLGTSTALKVFIPKVEFVLLSTNPESDSKWSERYKIKIIEGRPRYLLKAFLFGFLWMVFNKLHLPGNFLLRGEIIKEYSDADIIIDISGISFRDDFTILGHVIHCARILLGVYLKKPVVKYTQSLGPFNRWLNRRLAKICLKRTSLIVARGKITKRYLEELKIYKEIYLCADPAFILDPAPEERISEILINETINGKILVGISVNAVIDLKLSKDIKLQNKYTTAICKIADYLIDKTDAYIVFIPHSVEDIYLSKKIYGIIRNKNKVKLITNDYSVEELKGLIGRCDIFIGSRFHSLVAAISMGIPSIAIGWAHKYHELMEMAGEEEFVCDFDSMTFEELKLKIDELYKNREKIKSELLSKHGVLLESNLSGAKLIEEILNS